ncbi:hypothetical protein DFH09DRAFT_1427983, partial [Mycena vulgaris]
GHDRLPAQLVHSYAVLDTPSTRRLPRKGGSSPSTTTCVVHVGRASMEAGRVAIGCAILYGLLIHLLLILPLIPLKALRRRAFHAVLLQRRAGSVPIGISGMSAFLHRSKVSLLLTAQRAHPLPKIRHPPDPRRLPVLSPDHSLDPQPHPHPRRLRQGPQLRRLSTVPSNRALLMSRPPLFLIEPSCYSSSSALRQQGIPTQIVSESDINGSQFIPAHATRGSFAIAETSAPGAAPSGS